MLILNRRGGEKIRVRIPTPTGPIDVWLTVVSALNNRVSLGIAAPQDVVIEREEVIGKEPNHEHAGRNP